MHPKYNMLNYDPNEHSQELLVLYALLKNAGVQRKESVVKRGDIMHPEFKMVRIVE